MTFFSGTDINTLYEEGKERNNFLSLIVNNAREYSACITEKEVRKVKKHINSRVPFFGNNCVKAAESEEEEEEVLVKYYPLTIEFENDDKELLDRIEEMKKKKASATKASFLDNIEYKSPFKPLGSDFDLDTQRVTHPKDPTLFDVSPYEKVTPKSDLEAPEICPEEVEQMVAQLVTGNLLITKLPQNMQKMLPTLNSMWEKSLNQNDFIVDALVEAVVGGRTDSEILAQACVDKLEELFTYDEFYPMQKLTETLLAYV